MTLRTRITVAQLEDLRTRKITTRDLAKKLGVSECHLSRTYPGHKINKEPPQPKQPKKVLREIRNKFRITLAELVKQGTISAEEAAKRANCSSRTIYRHLAKL